MTDSTNMAGSALFVGAGGIVGNNLLRQLLTNGWRGDGVARRPPRDIDGMRPVSADLRDRAALRDALKELKPTAVFIASWLRQATEAENIRVNAAMVRNLLAELSLAATVEHVALVTGLKHYLGPFE